MNQRKSGVLLSYVYSVIHIIVNLLYIPILLRTIGKEEYGLYQLVGSFVSYVSILESFISAGVLRYYCKYRQVGNEAEQENVLAISRTIYRVLALLVTLIGVALVFLFRLGYRSALTAAQMDEASFMLVLMIANLMIHLLSGIYTAAINAHERFVFLKLLQIGSVSLLPIAILLITRRLPYAYVVVLSQVLIELTVAILKWVFAKRTLGIRVVYHEKNPQMMREIASLSLSLLLALLADRIFWKTDQIIIGKAIDTGAVAVYSVGAQIYLTYSQIGTTISSVFMPRLSRLYDKEHDMAAVSDLFIRVGRISFEILSLVLIGFIFFGREFIQLWAGQSFGDAFWIAVIIMIPVTIDAIQNLGLSILQIQNRYFFRSKIYFAIALANIVLTVLLVQRIGIIGAAISTTVSFFLGNGLIMNCYYARTVKLDIRRFWLQIIRLAPSLLLCAAAGFLLTYIHAASRILEFVLHLAIFVPTAALILYAFGMNQYEKNLVAGLLRKLLRRRT